MAGWRVAGFSELGTLGVGGQGAVVLARHDGSGRLFAVKYLTDPRAIGRFRDEVRLLRRLDTPYVARVFDYVEHPGGGAAIVMEAVEGCSLREHLDRRGALTPEAALVTLHGSLLGLAAAHKVGIVHRDYKPANVLLARTGTSKLIDFGVATDSAEGGRAGTPDYMAPEQWAGAAASPATDVYAATCVFVECVSGRKPYLSGSGGPSRTLELSELHRTAPIPLGLVPEALRPLVERGLAKDPGVRPATAMAFAAELATAAAEAYGDDWRSRGTEALASAAAALAALAPVAALLSGGGAAAGGTAVGAASGTAAGAGGSAAGGTAVSGAGAGGAGAGGAGAGGAGAGGAGAGGAGGAGAGGSAGGTGGAGSVLRESARVAKGPVAKLGAGKAVAAGVAGVVVVGVAGTGVYTVTHDRGGGHPGRTVSAAPAALTVAVRSDTTPHGGQTRDLHYVAVSGNPALAAKINKALRDPIDKGSADLEQMAGGTEIVQSKVTMGVHSRTLLSVLYSFSLYPKPGQESSSNWVKNFTFTSGILIRLTDGAVLGPDAVFTPATFTANGLETLDQRIMASSGSPGANFTAACFTERADSRLTLRRADLLPAPGTAPTVNMAIKPTMISFDLNLAGGDHSQACREVQVDVPYTNLSGLLRPDFLTALR